MSAEEQEQQQRVIDELGAIGVPQVVAGTISTLVNLGYLRLGLIEGSEQHGNLAEAAMAIDAIAALTPVIGRAAPAEVANDLHATLASLQLAFAEIAGGRTASASESEQARVEAPPAVEPKAERPPIWTPRGEV